MIAQKTHPEVMEFLGRQAETVAVREGDAGDLRAKIAGCQAVLLGTWLKFTAELMDAAGGALKVISRTGAGVDNVDMEAATKRGIFVLNTPGVNAATVAEHAMALIVSLAKYIVFLDQQVRAGSYGARRMNLPVDLEGKTLGVVGFGAVGRLLAEKCKSAFNMRTLAFDPYITQYPEWAHNAGRLEEIFTNSDFISLHVPLTDQTRHLINATTLSLMKPTAFLINTSRGGIVDEDALYDYLNDKKIAGAALDVLENEPPGPGDRLLSLPNIILTPHTAALTGECSLRVAMCAARGIADYFEGKMPAYIYNKDSLELF
jgi:D-3-phosphoglycerate dehydrogenase